VNILLVLPNCLGRLLFAGQSSSNGTSLLRPKVQWLLLLALVELSQVLSSFGIHYGQYASNCFPDDGNSTELPSRAIADLVDAQIYHFPSQIIQKLEHVLLGL